MQLEEAKSILNENGYYLTENSFGDLNQIVFETLSNYGIDWSGTPTDKVKKVYSGIYKYSTAINGLGPVTLTIFNDEVTALQIGNKGYVPSEFPKIFRKIK